MTTEGSARPGASFFMTLNISNYKKTLKHTCDLLLLKLGAKDE